jgi:hypothetical protein
MSDQNAPVNFLELLAEPLSNFVRKPNLPGEKTFFGKILRIEAGKGRPPNEYPLYRVHVRLTDPGPDVSKETINALREAGYNLGDFEVYRDFYLNSRGSLAFLKDFVETLGFPTNVDVFTVLKIDRQTGLPTPETQTLLQGRDVVGMTGPANEKGQVWPNLNSLAGVKR